MTEIVTNAGEEYDGFGARTVEWLSHGLARGLDPVRLRVVAVPDEHADWQRGRYASGLHLRLTRAELAGWIDAGLLAPMPEPPPAPDDDDACPHCGGRATELLEDAVHECYDCGRTYEVLGRATREEEIR